MSNPWDADEIVIPAKKVKSNVPWADDEVVIPAAQAGGLSDDFQPPSDVYDAPYDAVEPFGPPVPANLPPEPEQFGPPDLPQYQPLDPVAPQRSPLDLSAFSRQEQARLDPELLRSRMAVSRGVPSNQGLSDQELLKRTGEDLLFRDMEGAERVYNEELRAPEDVVALAVKDFESGASRPYNAQTRTYEGINPAYAAIYDKVWSDLQDRKRVSDLLNQTENMERQANLETARDMGPFLTQLASTGERLGTGLASVPLRVTSALGLNRGSAAVEELARRSSMTGQAADEVAKERGGFSKVSNVLGKGAGMAAEAFLNRSPGKYGAELAGGVASALTTYNENKSRGVDTKTAAANAIGSGLLEGGIASQFKRFGLGGLESLVAGAAKKGIANFGMEVAAELTEENVTTLAQGVQARLTELMSGRDDLGGFKTRQDVLDAVEETTTQTLAAMGMGKAAVKAGEIGASPGGFKEYLKRAPREILEQLSSKDELSRRDAQRLGFKEFYSAAQRAEMLEDLKQVVQEQGIENADPAQRVGAEAVAPIPQSETRGMDPADFDKAIQEGDSVARRNLPTPVDDQPFELGPQDQTADMDTQERKRVIQQAIMREGNVSEQEAQRLADAAVGPVKSEPSQSQVETVVPPKAPEPAENPALEMPSDEDIAALRAKGYSQQAAIQKAREQAGSTTISKAIRKSEEDLMAARGIERVAPDEAARELQSEAIDRALEDVGVGRPAQEAELVSENAKRKKMGLKPLKPRSEAATQIDYDADRDRFDINQIREKSLEDLTGDEAKWLVGRSEITGLRNKKAYVSAERKAATPHKASIDVNGLKQINDRFGHEAGDALIEAVGDVLRSQRDLDVFHFSGDEFVARGRDASSFSQSMQNLESELLKRKVVFKGTDGKTYTLDGIRLGYGIAPTIQQAEQELSDNKAEQERLGKRELRSNWERRFKEDKNALPKYVVQNDSGTSGGSARGGKADSGGDIGREGRNAQANKAPKPIAKDAVSRVFQNSKVDESDDGYTVTLPKGKSFKITFDDDVKISYAQAKREFAAKGYKLTKEKFNEFKNTGKLFAKGAYHKANGHLSLTKDATEKDLAHESLHALWDDIDQADKNALIEQYSKVSKSPDLVEEDIAKARENWDGSVKGKGDEVFKRVYGEQKQGAPSVARIAPKPESEKGPPKPPSKPPVEPEAQKPSKEPYGRPDLANQALEPDKRDFVDDVDEAGKAAPNEVRNREVARKQAEEEYAKNPEVYQKKLLAGNWVSNSEKELNIIWLAEKDIHEKARKENTVEAWTDAVLAQRGWREGGTEQGRAFAARKDLVMTPKQRLIHMLTAPDLKHERMIKNAKTEEAKQAAIAKWAKRIGEIKNSLGDAGIDLDAELSPIDQAKAERVVSAGKSSWVAMLREVARNNYLSAPISVTRNISSNLLHGTKRVVLDRAVEGLLVGPAMRAFNKISKGGYKVDAATLGEVADVFRGFWPNVQAAWADSVMAFKTEQSAFDRRYAEVVEGQTAEQLDKVAEGRGVAIPGKAGRIIRMADRLNRWGDEFATSLFSRMEAAAQAHRIARNDGLKGEKMSARVSELMNDPKSEAWVKALEEAAIATFKGKNKLSDAIVNFRDNTMPEAGSFLMFTMMPFVKTPVNIYKEGLLQATPLGWARIAYQMANNQANGDPILKGTPKHVAQQIIVGAMYAYLMGALKEDEDALTGTAGFGPNAEGQFNRNLGKEPNAFKALGQQWNYANFEPMATGVSLAADIIKARLKGEEGVVASIKNIAYSAEEKTFMKTIADLVGIAEALRSPEEGAGAESIRRFATNWATGWTTPNIMKNPRKNMREQKDELRAWGKGQDYKDMALKRLGQAFEVPWMSPEYFPKRDAWGNVVKKTQPTGRPLTDSALRIVIPMLPKEIKYNKADRIIVNYNNTAKDGKEWYPSIPRPDYKVKDEVRYMTEAQYDKFLAETGAAVLKKIENTNWDPAKPTEQQINYIKRWMTEERTRWKKLNLAATSMVANDEEYTD